MIQTGHMIPLAPASDRNPQGNNRDERRFPEDGSDLLHAGTGHHDAHQFFEEIGTVPLCRHISASKSVAGGSKPR